MVEENKDTGKDKPEKTPKSGPGTPITRGKDKPEPTPRSGSGTIHTLDED